MALLRKKFKAEKFSWKGLWFFRKKVKNWKKLLEKREGLFGKKLKNELKNRYGLSGKKVEM